MTTEVLVIGAGPGGYVAAIRAAQLGYDVTMIDKAGELGGMCLHHGCIPTKAMIHAAQLYHDATHAQELGILLSGSFDMAKMQAWKRSVVTRLAAGIAELCRKYEIRVIKASARFVNPTQVVVEGDSLDFNTIEFRYCVIATGSRPKALPGMPFGGRILSSRETIELEKTPSTVCVIGGGYIGIELGKMLRKAGSTVTIMESASGILTLVDPEISAIAMRRLGAIGVEVLVNTKPEKIEATEQDVRITVNGQVRAFEYLLVAVGHAPVTDGLQLNAAGVTLDERGFIIIDKQCKTSTHNIFAVGDVTGGMMLAHKAFAQGKVAAEVIAGQPSTFEPACIPAVIFSDPEIGTVGMREEEARKAYGNIKVGTFPFAALGKAMAENATEGFVKIITNVDGVVLGVHAVGPGVTDYISEAALAIEMGAKAEDIASTIHPHPTLGESIAEAAEALLGKSIHTFQAKK